MIEITTPLKSRPYLDMTIESLEGFGAEIENQSYERFIIPGNQVYSKNEYTVEGDYSGAAFILGAAALAIGDRRYRRGESQGCDGREGPPLPGCDHRQDR